MTGNVSLAGVQSSCRTSSAENPFARALYRREGRRSKVIVAVRHDNPRLLHH